MANGPLFAVSSPLARMVSDDSIPLRWLDGIQASDVARSMKARNGRIPNALAGFSCFPMGDSVFGFWLSDISRHRRVNLTLVNSPLGVQHFAWGSWQVGCHSHPLSIPSSPRLSSLLVLKPPLHAYPCVLSLLRCCSSWPHRVASAVFQPIDRAARPQGPQQPLLGLCAEALLGPTHPLPSHVRLVRAHGLEYVARQCGQRVDVLWAASGSAAGEGPQREQGW